MNIVKVSNGKVELRKDTGSLIRTIVSSGVVDADLNNDGSLILVTTVNGKVELRKESGSLIRTIVSSNAINAQFAGSEIQVKLKNGRIELRKESGSLIRTIYTERMKFLKEKFFDKNNHIQHFLGDNNTLLALERNPAITEEIKKQFTSNFIEELIKSNIIARETINSISESNPWSIDFPSWIGSFNESKGKRFLIIGAEPHIHFKYIQTVYGFHGEKNVKDYLENDHAIFRYLSELLASKFKLSNEEALSECYLTDLFPLSPLRGTGLSVGTADGIQMAIGNTEAWGQIRAKYAEINLPQEIQSVKPQIIITQGKEVLLEIIKILGITERTVEKFIPSQKGNGQYVRRSQWQNITIISIPHIGSKRMRTFWQNNLEETKKAFNEI